MAEICFLAQFSTVRFLPLVPISAAGFSTAKMHRLMSSSSTRNRLTALHRHLAMAGDEPAAIEQGGSKEQEAAIASTVVKDSGAPTIFDKIISKQIPSTIVYEDDKVLAFRDLSPQAPTHILLIPKHRDGLTQLSKAEERHEGLLGHLLYAAKIVAKQEGLGEDGFRIVINDGPMGCQSVYHLHLHLLGGRQMKWPPG